MRRTLLIALLAVLSSALTAQNRSEKVDSLVSLLSAQSVQLLEKDGSSYRKVTGPARFFHNNTYLVCDTALWNMDKEEIDCMGNVKILQNETVLSSDKLTYLINMDLAQFRGGVVQLEDKDHNTLRTRHLDYNTKDSVAVFEGGGAFRDQDGQIIESSTGTYESKLKLFTFVDNVNMFTDSIFVKTTRLEYDTDRNKAWFGRETDAWKDDDMLSSNAGWYDRNRELFLFYRDVHGMTEDKEVWSDSLYFWRNAMDVEMLGHVQMMDTVNNYSAVAGKVFYQDSISKVTMTRNPAIVGKTGDSGQPSDTVYIGADTLYYKAWMAFQIDSSRYKAARTRLKNAMSDAVTAFRIKAAEEAKKAAEEAKKKDPNFLAKQAAEEAAKKREDRKNRGLADTSVSLTPPAGAGKESPKSPLDSMVTAQTDSLLAVFADSTAAARDSLSAAGDSLSVRGSLSVRDSLSLMDTLASRSLMPRIDSLVSSIDSLSRSMAPAPAIKAAADSSVVPLRDSIPPLDSAAQARVDSLAKVFADSVARADSIRIADSIAALPKDSTRFGFLTGIRNVRLFRTDIQMRCDSLEYCDLDSLVRLYRSPVVWNEVRRQYAADSIHIVTHDGALDRAYLMSNSFIIIQEDTLCFDQIRSTEMLAFFDSTGALRRFDALGEANAVFYLQEDSVFATVNKSQSKMLSTEFVNGDVDRVYYFDSPKTDAYPLAQMSKEDRVLKGFNWLPDDRPRSRKDITDWKARPSQRAYYARRPRAKYTQTDIYFPGYMAGVYKQMRENEIRRQERERMRKLREEFVADSIATALRDSIVADSLRVIADSLHLADSLKAVQDSLKAVQDSLKAVQDSLKAVSPADSLSSARDTIVPHVPTKEELRAAEKERKRQEKEARKKAREEARAARIAAKEKEWARLDSLDAVKDSLAKIKEIEKNRARKLKQLERMRRQELKDMKKLERFRQRYEKKKAREMAREAAREAKRKAKEAARAMDKPEALPDSSKWMDIGKVIGEKIDMVKENLPDSLAIPDSSGKAKLLPEVQNHIDGH